MEGVEICIRYALSRGIRDALGTAPKEHGIDHDIKR